MSRSTPRLNGFSADSKDQFDQNGNPVVMPVFLHVFNPIVFWRRQSRYALNHLGGSRS